ncbi:D-isomer-specific 2-hydroxyacid dehydrogenase-like protein [Durotheca rogersii]|uniref:D-isomer-specific 2-hydroxyacid dehydrogenase-like protein n=1 Tax=Durotheca rogersii TaxID=419775 RepID=UPI00221F292A|nr:D-isomer-specific 2-hydroxyacid dehydrogenase-like protein [Durotheca rogersii]KAI5859634.1 D-isomer-specific 2-hydroxyacid dehydrogenase-like protein [Durotheca rogersii]
MALPKIAVLDDYQKLSEKPFDKLRAAGYEVTVFTDTLLPYNHPDTPQDIKDALARRLEPFGIISTMRERTPFPAELVGRLPNLKLLLTTGKRNAALDVRALAARGVPVIGTAARPGHREPDSTTQHCVALILALARNVPQDDAVVKAGGWQTTAATGLAGKTLGVVGLGRLGASVARIMHLAFGMRVVAWSPNLTQERADERAQAVGLPVEGADGKTFATVGRDALFATADVVTVQLVLSERSRGLITAADLGRLKPSALFVNTARGPLVVEADLLDVARRGAIRGVALDVFEIEPLPRDSEWVTTRWGEQGRSRVVLSPHMGYVEGDTIASWYETHVENILRWEKGEALEAVFADTGY